MRRRACLAAAGSLLLAGLVPSPAFGTAQPRAGHRPAVWVVGDSVTVFSEGPVRSALRAAADGQVEIDAESGRNVLLLDDLVRQQLVRDRLPRTMVLALGTNPDPSWTRNDFRRVVDSIPDSVSVVLVTVYRAPGTAPAWVLRSMADYSRWMQELAAGRDDVCLAPWRARVKPRAERLTLDGVHPNSRGADVFARVVAEAVQRCATD